MALGGIREPPKDLQNVRKIKDSDMVPRKLGITVLPPPLSHRGTYALSYREYKYSVILPLFSSSENGSADSGRGGRGC